MTVVGIVWTILAGVGVAVFYLWYVRRYVGVFVRKLIEIDATSEETAVSLAELHCKKTLPLRRALRKDGSLSSTVKTVQGNPTRYYLPKKQLDRAKSKYRKENASVPFLLLSVCLLIVIGALFTLIYPLFPQFSEFIKGLLE